MLRSLAGPLGIGTSAILAFTSVNLLALAVPKSFSFATPHHMSFLDPNGDGILTGAEIVGDVAFFSVGLLRTVLVSCVYWWLSLAKSPPEGYSGDCSEGMPHLFWRALLERQGVAVIVNLTLNAFALVASALAWFRFAGISPQTVLTFSGVGGVAFGFASQNLIGNLVGGLMLLVTRPFKEGDFIESDGTTGVVRRLGWNFTEIQTDSGHVVYLPNSDLLQTKTRNRTASGHRQVQVEVPVRFARGGFERCPAILKGLESRVLEECNGDYDVIREPVAVLLGFRPSDFSNDPVAVIKVELDLSNSQSLSLDTLDCARSEMNIAAMRYLKEQGCEVVGLEQQ